MKAKITREKLSKQKDSLEDLLKRRFFYTQSFSIYEPVGGLYDYGPPGCAIKTNLEAFWREHFVLEEDMLEIACTNLTPEKTLKTSGHVDKFTDLMVKDPISHMCYRADKLLVEFIEKHLEKEKAKLTPEKVEEFKKIIDAADTMKEKDLHEQFQKLGIKSPDTGNALSEPYPFNLMFGTEIGPTGTFKGYLRPETAQGIFVNFRKLLEYNGGRIPFACAQIGTGFRNEIAPRSGLLRVREFTMGEIEHFVDPDDKAHPKFKNYKHYKLPLLSQHQQDTTGTPLEDVTLEQAVKDKVINNETLAYFMARTYLFLTLSGIDEDGVRFRQHRKDEMAHYASDCWDAEILTSYGWIECVGIADRACFDLGAHSKASGVPLVAARKFKEAKKVPTLKLTIDKGFIGKNHKDDFKTIVETLEALEEQDKTNLVEKIEKNEHYEITVNGKVVKVSKEFVKKHEKITLNVMEEKFVPSVIEPSFGFGRILYCLFEHQFRMRNEKRTFLSLPARIAPIKCSILTIVCNDKFEPIVEELVKKLKKSGISNKVDDTGSSIGKRYARTDEVGIPFGVTIDFDTLTDKTVTLREIETCVQVRIKMEEVPQVLSNIIDGYVKWEDVIKQYPIFKSKDEDADDK
jgi:glycyl-tRNA synthetase